MQKNKKPSASMLNDHDRKVLDKYTKYYTNLIESSTARTEILDETKLKGRKD